MVTMATPRKKAAKRTDTAAVMVRLTPEEDAALESCIKSHRIEPKKVSVVRLAIKEFLKREGHWPEPDAEE
ncbi:hypothetical protein BH11PLA2_BH11PLA2_32570 [soil metagenome]